MVVVVVLNYTLFEWTNQIVVLEVLYFTWNTPRDDLEYPPGHLVNFPGKILMMKYNNNNNNNNINNNNNNNSNSGSI